MIKNKTSRLNRLATLGTGRDRDYFIENLSLLIASGMPILEALGAIIVEVRSKNMRLIITRIQEAIESGSTLWRALDDCYIFPPHAISLIRIGEESGKLSENLKVVGKQQEKDRMFQSKVRSAMMYPVFVLSLTLIVGVGIAWFILPKLALVFSQLKLQLPWITKMLIGAGTFLGEHGVVVMPIFLILSVLIIYFVFYFPKTKTIGQTIIFWAPGINDLIKQVELARFTYLLGTLLNAGLPVVQAIGSVEQATFFPQYKKFYTHLKKNIEEGYSFQKSFNSYNKLNRLIPMPVQQLIVAGEKSGTLPDTLLKINENYEVKIDTTTKNLAVILEPILLVIVWLGVVAVALAVILPIYNLIGGFNTDPQMQKQSPSVIEQIMTPSTTEEIILEPKIENITNLSILSNDAGYLNVRSEPLLSSEIVLRVIPDEIYQYVNEKDGWYEIILSDGTSGWVFGQYVKIL